MSWMKISLLTALSVGALITVMILANPPIWVWAVLTVGLCVFVYMVSHNPIRRFGRMAHMLLVVWASANAVPEISAWINSSFIGEAGFESKGTPGAWFQVACGLAFCLCLILDYLCNRGDGDVAAGFGQVIGNIHFGIQRQHITGSNHIVVQSGSGSPTRASAHKWRD